MGSRPSRLIFILFFLLVGSWTVIYRPPELKEGPEETDLAAFERRATFTDGWRRFHRARLEETRADNIAGREPQKAVVKYELAAGYYSGLAAGSDDKFELFEREGFLNYVYNRSLTRVENKISDISSQ